ncbi:MAG TPA: arginase family protein, partial [Xanthobacteraceae bacterium]|nr:arginase family protein [Xanthobacteraceae bacterium]
MTMATAETAGGDLYRGPLTFMGAPFGHDLNAAKAAILGAPFDCGTHPFRIGARQGPESIREQSRLVRPFQSEFADYDIRARLGLVDCGDAAVTPGRIEPSFERIEEAAFRIVSAGAAPIGFGGDGSVSLPLVRAAARRWPNLALLHVDSHTDAYPYEHSEPYTAAT